MIRNFFIVALRNLYRNKIISLIHILGLSIGISASLVIFLIVSYESSFDKFEKDGERIYRVVMDMNFNGTVGHSSAVPAPLANAAEAEVTGIDAVVPVMSFQGDGNVKVAINKNGKETVFKKQSEVIFTNAGYFELLPFQWLAGSASTAMREPFSVVLTEQRARLYFPTLALQDIVGKQIIYNGDLTTSVTGIVSNLDEVTDLTSLEFISYNTIAKTVLKHNFMMEVWGDWMAYSTLFVKLSTANDKKGVTSQLNAVLKRNWKSEDPGRTMLFALQPLNDMHFNTDYAGFGQRVANKSTLYGLTLIAAFLLLLACINFTNLATAQTSQRAKEIGIRKSIGSSRKQLILQFLNETFFITLLAAYLSMALAPLLLNLFSDFIPQGIRFEPLRQPGVLLFLLILVIIVTFMSGIYPALVLSGLRPASILKGQVLISSGFSTTSFRKVLTVSQFVIAQFFVFGAFMVTKQIHYAINQDLGYRKDAIIYFDVPRGGDDHREQLMNEIRMIPEVSIATTGFLPPAISGAAFGNIVYQNGKEEITQNVQLRWGEPQFLDVYKIGIVAGRNIHNGKDNHEVLINETYAKAIGFQNPSEALNHELIMNKTTRYTIVGVMHDFHEGSLHAPIGPLVFRSSDSDYFFHLALTPQSEQWPSALEKIGKSYNKFYPEQEFDFKFFDDEIAGFYQQEQNTSRLLNWTMGLSILISCMGLLGLVMHTSETRTKEIGIRKILGASVANIISILSLEFIKLVMIAFAIAVPLSWWSADKWLQGFAYRTPISWWVFGLSGVTLIVVALVTIGAQTIKTAVANPINSLRSE